MISHCAAFGSARAHDALSSHQLAHKAQAPQWGLGLLVSPAVDSGVVAEPGSADAHDHDERDDDEQHDDWCVVVSHGFSAFTISAFSAMSWGFVRLP